MGFRNLALCVLACGLVLANAGCSGPDPMVASTSDTPIVVKTAPNVLAMPLQRGQILSVISIDLAPGESGKRARENYLNQAFALSGKYGLKPHGTLKVSGNAVGEFAPGAVSFFSWPDATSAAEFAANPAWAPIKATRPKGWDELRVHDVLIDQDITLEFKSDKTYTMATAWINPQQPLDYDRYLRGIEDAVSASGGRFVLDMRDLAFESHAHLGPAPNRVIFVEWDMPEKLAAFQKTEGFKANAQYLRSGTTRFELLILNHTG